METLSVGLLLYPGFEVLDVAGPIEVLNVVSRHLKKPLTLSVIAQSLDAVSPATSAENDTSPFISAQRYIPTHTLLDAPALDILVVPGGLGLRQTNDLYVDYVARVYKGYEGHSPVKYLFSICTGSLLFTLAGALDGKSATTNKRAWQWVTSQGPKTTWLARARWVQSENVWTTSGVAAGTDGMLAFVASLYGEQSADDVCHFMEYVRVKEPSDDPWAEVNGCEDVLAKAV